MFLAFYTFSYPCETADAGKIARTVIRPIMTDSEDYAKKLIQEYHSKRGEKIESEIIELVKGLP